MPNNSRGTLLRHWEMLKLIPKEPASTSVKALHEKLEQAGYTVTKRTVERDLISLSEAGFPLQVDDSEQPHLWSWVKGSSGFHAPTMSVSDALLTVMSAEALESLVPGVISDSLKDLKSEAERVLAATSGDNHFADWKDKVAIKEASQPLIPPEICPDVRRECYEALLKNEQISIEYESRSKGKQRKPYVVNPLGVIQRGWMTYLVCTFAGYEDMRMLAMNRIISAERIYSTAIIPEDFNLQSYIDEGRADFGSGEKTEIRALISERLKVHLEEAKLSSDQSIKAVAEGYQLKATVNMTPQLSWWLKSLDEELKLV